MPSVTYAQLGTVTSLNNTDLLATYPTGGPLKAITVANFRTQLNASYLPLAGGTMTGALVGYAGTESLPGYSFASDTDCGFYRIGANNVGLSIEGVKRWDFASSGSTLTGTLTVSGLTTLQAALTVGTTLGVTGAATLSSTLAVTGAATLSSTLAVTGASTFTGAIAANGGVNGTVGAGTPAAGAFTTITASSTLAVTGASTFTGAIAANGGVNGAIGGGTPAAGAFTTVSASGLTTLSGGGNITPAATPATTAIGWLGSPVVDRSGSATLDMTDAAKTQRYTGSGGHTLTIPANASVAYPIGTILPFTNDGSGNLTIAITGDTLKWLSSTGSRTLAAGGTAQAQKMTSTTWRITGDLLT